jgi:hypothetical protein
LWFSRAGIKQETVAKRMAAADPDAAEKPTEESV